MYKVPKIIRNIIYYTSNGGLNWRVVSATSHATKFLARRELTKDKYLGIHLTHYYSMAGQSVDLILEVHNTKKYKSKKLSEYSSNDYPEIFSILELIDPYE